MAETEEEKLLAILQNQPSDNATFRRLVQLYVRKGDLTHAFSLALDHFLLCPNEESCYQLYACRRQLYLSKEQELPSEDRDRMVIYPLSFSDGVIVLLGGRLGSKVTELQEFLEPLLYQPSCVILDFFNTRFIDSSSLGYLAQWLEERALQPYVTYGVDLNERVQVCFKYLELYPLIEGVGFENTTYSLPKCLFHLRKQRLKNSLASETLLCLPSYQLVPIEPEYSLLEKIWHYLTTHPEEPAKYQIKKINS